MSIQTIGDALKTALGSLVTSGALKQVFAPDELPDTVNLFPAALIMPGPVNYHSSLNNQFRPTFQILILIAKQDAPTALSRALTLMEPTGIQAAIEADRTLGGVVDDAKVVSNDGFNSRQWGAFIYLSTQFEVQVIS